VSRNGYVNLLQPQDRRSPTAGDSKEAIEARSRLLASGIGRTILDAFVEMALGLNLAPGSLVVELGAGAGEGLGQLAAKSQNDGVGIDISTAAASQAARRFPRLTWVVANVDRRVPIVDRSAWLVLSLHARRNPAECARILSAGHLLVAVPAADDLIELRETVMGDGRLRDRVEGVVAEHASLFDLQGKRTVRERRVLAREALVDLLHGTYRGARTSAVERVRALVPLEVTMSSDLLLFCRR
jgi:23S rRNA (guanine745-N1)-methyltransferase